MIVRVRVWQARERVWRAREKARACVCVNVCVAGERERVRVCVCERVCVCGGRECVRACVCVRMRACGGAGKRDLRLSLLHPSQRVASRGEKKKTVINKPGSKTTALQHRVVTPGGRAWAT